MGGGRSSKIIFGPFSLKYWGEGGGSKPTYTIVWAKYWGARAPLAHSKTTPLNRSNLCMGLSEYKLTTEWYQDMGHTIDVVWFALWCREEAALFINSGAKWTHGWCVVKDTSLHCDLTRFSPPVFNRPWKTWPSWTGFNFTILPWNMSHEICSEEIYPKESKFTSKTSPIRISQLHIW